LIAIYVKKSYSLAELEHFSIAMSKSYQVTLKKQLDTVSIRTNISYPLKSYLNIVQLILDSLGFRHQSFMKDNRRRKTPEFEFSSIFPTSYTRYCFFVWLSNG